MLGFTMITLAITSMNYEHSVFIIVIIYNFECMIYVLIKNLLSLCWYLCKTYEYIYLLLPRNVKRYVQE